MNDASIGPQEPPFLRAKLGAEPWAVGSDFILSPIEVSPDGSLVAGTLGRLVWVMRARDGAVLRWLETGSYSVNALRFSPDGERLVAVGDRCIVAWRVADGARVFELPGVRQNPKAGFSPDGTRCLVDAHEAQLMLDAATGEVLSTQPPPVSTDFQQRAAPTITADGRYALTSDRLLRVWNLATGAVTELPAPGAHPQACAVGEGADVVVAGVDQSLTRYDLSDGRTVVSGKAPGKVQGLFAEGDALWVYAEAPGLGEWVFTRYSPDTLEPVAGAPSLALPSYTPVAMRGDALWASRNGWVNRFSLRAFEARGFPSRGVCQSIRFDRGAAHLAACFGDSVERTALRWALADGARVASYEAPTHAALTLARDGAAVISHTSYGAGEALRTTLDAAAAQEHFDPGGASGANYVPGEDGRVIAIDAGALRVLPEGPSFPLPPRHKLGYRGAWELAAEIVVMCDAKRMTAFDLRAGAYIEPKDFAQIRTSCVVGERAWVLSDKGAQLWDARRQEKLRAVKIDLGAYQFPISVAASRDGKLLAVGGSTGSLLLIELDGAERSVMFRCAWAGLASACAFSDDGALLATGSAEPYVRVWSVAEALATAPAPKKPARAKKG